MYASSSSHPRLPIALCALLWLVSGSLSHDASSARAQLPDPFEYLPTSVAAVEEASGTAADTAAKPTAAAPPAAAEVTAEVAQSADPALIGAEPAPVSAEPQDAAPAAPPQAAGEQPAAAAPPANDAARVAPAADAPAEADPFFQANYAQATLIDFDGPILGPYHWYLNHRLEQAQRSGSDLIIIRLTTPGGDLEQSLQLSRRLRDIDWATTAVYIPEEAISGGAILSLGCDRILMQSGALIGDAGPVRLGMDGQFQHAEEKILSYLVTAIRELATAKNRPAAIAEAMVDRSVLLFQATDNATGRSTVLTEKETQEADIQARYRLGPPLPENAADRFLTLGARRATELGLADAVFASEKELLAKLKIGEIRQTRFTWVDGTVYWLNRPVLTAILLIVGLVGLYLELLAPGISVAGLTAVCCFTIFFWSHALGGTSGWLEVLLFLLGVVCLMCELFVVPGFGVFGLSGIAMLVISLIMASQDFLVPNSDVQWHQFQTNTVIVLGSVLGVIVLLIAQVLLLDSVPGLNRFRLTPPAGGDVAVGAAGFGSLAASPAQHYPEITLGEQGVAESDLRPSGKVILQGRLIDVVTEGDYVDAGTTVEVLHLEGNRIVVRKV